MNAKERLLKVAALGEPDRIPVILRGKFGAKFFGYTEKELDENVDKFVEVEVGTFREFGGDCVTGGVTSNMMEEALGSKFERFQDTGPKSITKPLIEKPADSQQLVKKLESFDFKKEPIPAMLLERITKLKQSVGKDIPVLAWTSAPFRSACLLRGVDRTYLDLFKDPLFVKELQKHLITFWIRWSDACINAGADILYTSNPTANGLNISRKHYQEFVHPYCKEMFSFLRKKGYVIFFHPCGKWNDRFDLVCQEGYHVLHLDKVDLKQFKTEWGDRVGIWGNVKTTQTLLLGTPEDVKTEARECISKAAKGGGFILGGDCVIPRDTPPQNVRAMVEAALEFDRHTN